MGVAGGRPRSPSSRTGDVESCRPRGSALRVLHVTPYFAPAFRYGGPPRSVLGLCQGLRRAGIDVDVLTTTVNEPVDLPASPPEGDAYGGVPTRYLPRAFPRRLFRVRGLRAALSAGAGRYDLVHLHGLWTFLGWAVARHARQRHVPYVISPHGMLDAWSMSHHAIRKSAAYWMVERRILTAAAFLHATSDPEATSCRLWSDGVPVVTVPHGVDVPERLTVAEGAFRARWGLPTEGPLVVFIGRLHRKKRLDLLAAAFERVRAVHPDAHLVIAGPDEGGYRRRAEPWFAAAGSSVRWTGELDNSEKWALLADATALVMCSDSENFGNSVLEALAAGVPPVVTHTCPWQELPRAGCGFWVPQAVEAIARALLDVLGDPVAARAMGARGRALARERYSWDSMAQRMIAHYEAVVAGRLGAAPPA
jgi:glycosyltransferase involved in cell wall biosynthesis